MKREEEISELIHIITNIYTYSGIIINNIHYFDNLSIQGTKEYFKIIEKQLKYVSNISMNPIKEQLK